MKYRLQGFALALILTACAAAVFWPGCTAYGEMRVSMPELGTDALSRWVAVLDTRMTAACR